MLFPPEVVLFNNFGALNDETIPLSNRVEQLREKYVPVQRRCLVESQGETKYDCQSGRFIYQLKHEVPF